MTRFGRETEAFFLLVGTIIGVGMFGIPFVFAAVGFWVGVIELTVTAAAVIIIHCAYAEIVSHAPRAQVLPGYVTQYLGPGAGTISKLSYLFGFSGFLLVYVLIGGLYLGLLLNVYVPGTPPLVGPFLFYALGMAIVFRGIRVEGFWNGVLTIALVIAIAVISGSLLPHVSGLNLQGFHPAAVALPYGVLLFSLAGAAVIPDMRILLLGTRYSLRKVAVWGTILPAGLYLLFAYAVVGATGSATTHDAIQGIAERFGAGYLVLGALIGFLAALTSFIPLTGIFKTMLTRDFGIDLKNAWVITAAIPPLLYLAGVRDFIVIISIIGAVGIGLDSVFILMMYPRAVPRAARGMRFLISPPLSFLLALMFTLGAVLELIHLLA